MKSIVLVTLFFGYLSLASAFYTFSGVATGVSISTITSSGWTVCATHAYSAGAISINTIRNNCNGNYTMVACYSSGSTTYNVAAYAATSDVWYPTGTGNVPHNANGVSWYYDPSYSMGK